MTKRLLIEENGGQRELALLRDKELLFYTRDAAAAVEAEQIYLGKADRMVQGVEAAFVRLGGEKVGFLPFSECREKPRSGDLILVQVKKPPVGNKAPYLTMDLSLAGRYVILTPRTRQFAVSRRVTEEAQRETLLAAARRLMGNSPFGLIMRAESVGVPDETLLEEINALQQKWETVLSQSQTAAAPGLLLGREDALSRLLRDEKGGIDEVWTPNPAALPPLPLPVRACDRPFSLYSVRDKLRKAFQRKVWLPCGGYLILERTEALTVVDVNSGKFVGKKSGTEGTFLQLNREAAREIARLLRLRAIGGIVIVDFVDMQSEESRAAVSAAFSEALRDDPVKTVLHGFTALGLMELTRKKSESSESPLPLCPHCGGTGILQEETP